MTLLCTSRALLSGGNTLRWTKCAFRLELESISHVKWTQSCGLHATTAGYQTLDNTRKSVYVFFTTPAGSDKLLHHSSSCASRLFRKLSRNSSQILFRSSLKNLHFAMKLRKPFQFAVRTARDQFTNRLRVELIGREFENCWYFFLLSLLAQAARNFFSLICVFVGHFLLVNIKKSLRFIAWISLLTVRKIGKFFFVLSTPCQFVKESNNFSSGKFVVHGRVVSATPSALLLLRLALTKEKKI